jgi:hypothetical protein
MAAADLLATLRLDLADPGAALFSEELLRRCLFRGVFQIARDLGITLAIVDGEIVPEPMGGTDELLILLGQIHACQTMRAATANAFSFSSGDKRVDKTKQPEHWAALEADLRLAYSRKLKELRPDAPGEADPYLITPGQLRPVIYEQGGDLECC